MRARTPPSGALVAAILTALVFGLALPIGACEPVAHSNAELAAADRSGPCIRCHMAEYRSTTHPLHAGKKPMTCEVCHSQEAWSPKVLHHEWKLDGAHEKTDCAKCHDGAPPTYEGTPKKCYGCHQGDFEKENDKSKKHATFAHTCDDCHSTTDWKHRHKKADERAD
jgi:hypothetical protein